MIAWETRTAQTSGTRAFGFECEACGHADRLHVRAKAKDTAAALYGLRAAAAAGTARRRAARKLSARMELCRDLARCPRCNRRSRSRVRAFYRRAALTMLGALVLPIAIGVLLSVVIGEEAFVSASVFIAIAAFGHFAIDSALKRLLYASAKRVQFESQVASLRDRVLELDASGVQAAAIAGQLGLFESVARAWLASAENASRDSKGRGVP